MDSSEKMSGKGNEDPDLVDFRPPKKKAETNERPSGTRFKTPTSDDEMATFCKGYVPQNTQKNTAWAVKVFSEWRAERNSISSEKQCPADLLDNPNVQELNYWLSRFVTEVRKRDGQPYPPRTIQQILAGLVKLAGRA